MKIDETITYLETLNRLFGGSEYIEALIEQLKKEKWISVKDKLPQPLKKVLCLWKDSRGIYYGFATYQHDDVWYVENQGMPEVVYWMPLPEPPKGECK